MKKMQQPPTVLTPKDCQYIEDILNHSLNLVKKTNLYYEMSKDQDVKDLEIEKIGPKFENHVLPRQYRYECIIQRCIEKDKGFAKNFYKIYCNSLKNMI